MTGQPTALTRAREIKTALLDHGVPKVSIELQVGRPTGGLYGGDDWNVTGTRAVAVMSHHVVSRYSPTSLTPVLALCKAGRISEGIGGPLSNGYGGWDLCYRILTCGMANHSGEGGPLTVVTPRGAFTIPLDSARAWAWGTEYEGGLSEADWDRTLISPHTGKAMTFREFMGRSNAALLEVHGIDPRSHMEHRTWADAKQVGRKIDRLGYTTDEGRAEAARYANATQEEDVMPLSDKVNEEHTVKEVLNRVDRYIGNSASRENQILQALSGLSTDIAAAVLAELPADAEGLTVQQVERAVNRGSSEAIRRIFGSLDREKQATPA